MPTVATTTVYDARTDAKQRVVIRGANGSFRVAHRKDGSILLRPLEPVESAPISPRTLRGMDEAIKNVRDGKRGLVVDMKHLARLKV